MFDVVQQLISHGHRLPDILDYTLPQVRAFSAAIERQRARHDTQWLSLITVGSRGDTAQLDKLHDLLRRSCE